MSNSITESKVIIAQITGHSPEAIKDAIAGLPGNIKNGLETVLEAAAKVIAEQENTPKILEQFAIRVRELKRQKDEGTKERQAKEFYF